VRGRQRAAEQHGLDLAGPVRTADIAVGVIHVGDDPVQGGPLDDRAGRLDLGQFRHGRPARAAGGADGDDLLSPDDPIGRADDEVAGRPSAQAGRRLAGRSPALKLVQDLHVRVINAATGELLRELIIHPDRGYQPTGAPPGPKPKTARTH